MRIPRHPSPASGGQSMIEFVIALMVIVILVTGIAQFIELGSARGNILSSLRGDVGMKAIEGVSTGDSPDYIRDWKEGEDETRHTADDKKQPGGGATLGSDVLSRSVRDPADWFYVETARNRDILSARSGAASALGFVHGGDSEEIDLLPAMRSLLGGKDSVTVGADLWMPTLTLEGFP